MKDKRESFNSRWGFILACIGSAVGMGNIWMFPTRVSLYGGGSFLIPYFIFVVVIASTGVIGEMSFGRAARSGPIDAFGMVCEKKGKRYAAVFKSFTRCNQDVQETASRRIWLYVAT